jgi:ABC-type antimicrobial peptide transport system permease subunit
MDARAAVAAVDPTVPVGAITTVDRLVGDRVGRHRLVMLALGLFGSVALVLSAAGVYGVVALTSRLRRREYAIRMALGAARGGVRWLVIRQALVVSGVGTVAGVTAAAAAAQSARGLLHGVAPLDPVTFAIAALMIPSLAVVAAWLPASQAERVDPVETLRAE